MAEACHRGKLSSHSNQEARRERGKDQGTNIYFKDTLLIISFLQIVATS
jgi:hypothetical protein